MTAFRKQQTGELDLSDKTPMWLGINFSSGVIEFDARGLGGDGSNGIGVAFHAQNDSIYDAIQIRPSKRLLPQFGTDVAYEAQPFFTWKKLRADRKTSFTKPMLPSTDADGWFHVKVSIQQKQVKVFVNDKTDPVIEVVKLNNFDTGLVGLFTSDGFDVANVVILKNTI